MNLKILIKISSSFFFSLLLISCNSTKSELETEINVNTIVPIKTLNRPAPSENGVISYSSYQVFVSRGGETITEISERLGINADRLALYNGLIVNYKPRDGEILALPERILDEEINTFENWTETSARESIQSQEIVEKIQISDPNNPIRHRVVSGDTAYSIARLYKVSVTSLAEWNGLQPDLKLNQGREIIIPAAASASDEPFSNMTLELSEKKPKAPIENENKTKFVSPEKETATISNVETLENIEPLESNETLLSNAVIPEKPYLSPVTGIIENDYNPTPAAGERKNNGIDYKVKVGTKVRAIGDGVVVLISEKAVGGSGKIILMKHANELISIYGGIDNLTIAKGDRVKKGDKIGSATTNKKSETTIIHFEIRKGMTSIDPKTLLE